MKNAHQIIQELRVRDIHVRQYFDGRCFELFVDGAFHSWWTTPIDCELAVRKVLGITNEQGLEVEAELTRRAGVS